MRRLDAAAAEELGSHLQPGVGSRLLVRCEASILVLKQKKSGGGGREQITSGSPEAVKKGKRGPDRRAAQRMR